MMNWKGCGRKRQWPNLGYYLSIYREGPKKTMRNLGQDNGFPGRDLNPGPPEYEAGVLTTRPRCSVNATMKIENIAKHRREKLKSHKNNAVKSLYVTKHRSEN
jgi:hypothetical protein